MKHPSHSHSPNFPIAQQKVGRRRFLKHSALAGAGMAFGASEIAAAVAARKPAKKALPQPNRSGIEHIVIAMMENRSFDHFLGWLPGADGRQAGLSYMDEMGMSFPTHRLGPDDYQGCSHPDPAHDYQSARDEYNGGKCDGWLVAGDNDDYAIGYYTNEDLAFLGGAAPAWTACDQYFSAIMASTYPNRIYQHAAQTDRLDNSLTISTLPTIWDRLAEHSISSKYYFSDLPLIALWGEKYLPITRHISEFFDDCAAGTLPRFSMVEPRFIGEELGITNDDHPHADIRNGEAFLNDVYKAVTSSPNWASTILVINYDEWGGFFDHVPPTKAPIPPADAALGSDGLRGFRVPTIIVSPFARRNYVAHGLYDHTSVLRMAEWRWNLRPLTVRDATANNIADVLDFSRRNLTAPAFNVPEGFFGLPCTLNPLADEWTSLAELAVNFGFDLVL